MFVTCRKRVKFTHPDNPNVVWEMKPGFIGEIPKWVEDHWYFTVLCKDGSISAIVSKKDKAIQKAVEPPPAKISVNQSKKEGAAKEAKETK